MGEAAAVWAAQLAAWAIPDEILAQAPESPWIHPVEMFTVTGEVSDSPSHRRAREVVPAAGTVLDVGCGGGRAAMALVPPAGELLGVDEQTVMLERFAEAAEQRHVAHGEFLGGWPSIAGEVPPADVVVCHHVVYNVADLVPFALALDSHARARVVLELPQRHPLASMAPYWKKFWDLDRPDGPTSQDCLAVVREAGCEAHLEEWVDETWSARSTLSVEQQARFLRIRLCLPEAREPEVVDALQRAGDPPPRRSATVWWDVPPHARG
jgi:SAM-dependent methyltransferase